MPQGRTHEGTGPPAPALLTHTHTSASGTRPSWRWFRFGSIPGGMNGVVGGNENERKIRLDVGSERLWLSHFGEDGRIGQQAFRSQHLLCLERSVRSHSRLSLPTQRWLHSGSLGSYHVAFFRGTGRDGLHSDACRDLRHVSARALQGLSYLYLLQVYNGIRAFAHFTIRHL